MTNASVPSSISLPGAGYADLGIDWEFGGKPGWRLTECELGGVTWEDQGPASGEAARAALVRAFELDESDSEMARINLFVLSPEQLAQLPNKRSYH